MDDYYGDPRNYDPNYDPDNQSPPPNGPGPKRSGPPYTLDNLPPAPAPGHEWVLNPNTGEFVDITQNSQNPQWPESTDRPGTDYNKDATAVDNKASDPTYGGYTPPGGGGSPKFSGGPDYSQLLPFSPYREYGPFSPSVGKFSYDAFAPTTETDLENQPGYKEGQTRLQKQIEAGAAYRGMVRSGMTLGDLWNGLDTNKSQRFSEYDNRRFRDWGANRENAWNIWNTNYGMERDQYDRGATENDRFNNYRFNTENASFNDALERWKAMVSSLTATANAGRP